MRKKDLLKIYEAWLQQNTSDYDYLKNIGALEILLWLKENGMLKEIK